MSKWRPGERVAGIELLSELGRGGGGVVYRGKNVETGQEVALKSLDLGATPSARERFLREGQAQARVDQHPNVVRVHGAGEVAGRGYLILGLATGGDLGERLRAGPIAIEDALRISIEVGRALAHAHAHGVLHRDVKPRNVLFHEDGRAQLVDFGLARLVSEGTITNTGEILGTPAYMSPEQADGAKGISAATDVYGLGALLYATLTGRPPFEGGSMVEVLTAILRRAPVPPRQLRAEIPSGLEALCLRALAKDPAERYPSAEAMVSALEGLGVEDSPGGRGRAPILVGLGVVGALVLGGGVIYALPEQKPAARESLTPSASREDVALQPEQRGRYRLGAGDRVQVEFDWVETNEILYRSEASGVIELEVAAVEPGGYRMLGSLVLAKLRGASQRSQRLGGDSELGVLSYPPEVLALAKGRRELSCLFSPAGRLSEAKGLHEIRRLLRSKAPTSVEILEGDGPESEGAYLIRRTYDAQRLATTLSQVLDLGSLPWRDRSGGRTSLQVTGLSGPTIPSMRTEARAGAVFSLHGKGRISPEGLPSLRIEQLAESDGFDPIRTSFAARVRVIRAR